MTGRMYLNLRRIFLYQRPVLLVMNKGSNYCSTSLVRIKLQDTNMCTRLVSIPPSGWSSLRVGPCPTELESLYCSSYRKEISYLHSKTSVGNTQRRLLVTGGFWDYCRRGRGWQNLLRSWQVYEPLGAGLKKEVIVEDAATEPPSLFLLFGDGFAFLSGGGEATVFFVGSKMSTLSSWVLFCVSPSFPLGDSKFTMLLISERALCRKSSAGTSGTFLGIESGMACTDAWAGLNIESKLPFEGVSSWAAFQL